jgi:predicted phage baseplate assembly protein
MPVPLPNLDDRRWADLVEEGRSLIPLYARETWTDHNAHDPGITLMELFAWIAEMDLYQINRIPDRHRRKFLALVGIAPEPPRPARTVLSFAFKDGADLLELPAEIEFEGKDALGQAVRFRTLDLINVIPGRLVAIQLKDTTGFHDLTERWQRGEVISLFGTMPKPGAELYLGFSHPLPKDRWVNLFWSFAHPRSGENERRRLIEEAKARHDACRPPSDYGCKPNTEPAQPVPDKTDRVASHHGVRLVFEALIARGAGIAWQRLDAEENEVEDDTRVLTLDGTIRIRLLQDMARPDNDPRLSRDLYHLRVRFAAGAYDTPPLLRTVVLNGVRAEQAVPADIMLPTGDSHSKPVRVVYGTGAPHQRLRLAEAPVIESSLELFTVEDNARRVWELRRDFDASKRDSAHFLLDPKDGTVLFGDGESGRVPPLEA